MPMSITYEMPKTRFKTSHSPRVRGGIAPVPTPGWSRALGSYGLGPGISNRRHKKLVQLSGDVGFRLQGGNFFGRSSKVQRLWAQGSGLKFHIGVWSGGEMTSRTPCRFSQGEVELWAKAWQVGAPQLEV